MPSRTVLHSIDIKANRFRFFVLEVRERADGHHELVRRWGRIGVEGRTAVELVGDPTEVAAAFDHLLARRVQRGYRVVEDRAPAGAPAAAEGELGSLVAWEAHLLDALVRTRKRLAALRDDLRPVPNKRVAPSAYEQLELFRPDATQAR